MSLFILIFHPLLCTCTCNIQPTRQVSFFSLFPDHVIDHLIAMCLPHGFIVTDPIASSQSAPLLVSMFALCWKPNMVRAQCAFSIYILPLPSGFSSLNSQSFPQVHSALCFSLPFPYAYSMPLSLLFIVLYLLGVFLSGSLMQLYTEPSIGELFSISGPPRQ